MFKVKVELDEKHVVLSNFLINGLSSNLPFAIWSPPQAKEFSALLSLEVPQLRLIVIETGSPGFVIAPFKNAEGGFFLNADYYYSGSSGLLTSTHANFEEKDFIQKKSLINSLPEFSEEVRTQNYTQIVALAKDRIRQGQLKKVVIAREDLIHVEQMDLIELIFELRNHYQDAFISLVFIPPYGVWLGATPELLIEVNKEKVFRTIALAGTQRDNLPTNTFEASWTQKEIEEQALVNRYIINCFKHLRLRDYEDEGPRTVKAGDLLHLRTDFSVDMKKLDTPLLGSQMLSLLHPTSAVGGMPREEALTFIDLFENIDRKLFSGYLGPVNIEEETSLYVNLRCANIFNNHAVLYAGAGITQDSDPQKEYLETELKMATIGKFLKRRS